MRKVFILSIAAILFFAACDNSGSSTVGTYDTSEASSSNDKNEAQPYVDTSRETAGSSANKDTADATDKKDMKTKSPAKSASKP